MKIKIRAFRNSDKGIIDNVGFLSHGVYVDERGEILGDIEHSFCVSTGLKDKNNVEIFEHDVLVSDELGKCFEIVWDKDGACFDMVDRNGESDWTLPDYVCVYGNTMQDPDSLNRITRKLKEEKKIRVNGILGYNQLEQNRENR
jgi:hypothetical protein